MDEATRSGGIFGLLGLVISAIITYLTTRFVKSKESQVEKDKREFQEAQAREDREVEEARQRVARLDEGVWKLVTRLEARVEVLEQNQRRLEDEARVRDDLVVELRASQAMLMAQVRELTNEKTRLEGQLTSLREENTRLRSRVTNVENEQHGTS